jgi:hypothetical protein
MELVTGLLEKFDGLEAVPDHLSEIALLGSSRRRTD